jgi:hypothetical protein
MRFILELAADLDRIEQVWERGIHYLVEALWRGPTWRGSLERIYDAVGRRDVWNVEVI